MKNGMIVCKRSYVCVCSGSECTNLLCHGCLNPNFTYDPFNVEIKRHKRKIRSHTSLKQVKCDGLAYKNGQNERE